MAWANMADRRAYERARYKEDPEHRERRREAYKRWYWRHRQSQLEKNRRWRRAHRAHLREYQRRWAKNNRGWRRVYNREYSRRIGKSGVPVGSAPVSKVEACRRAWEAWRELNLPSARLMALTHILARMKSPNYTPHNKGGKKWVRTIRALLEMGVRPERIGKSGWRLSKVERSRYSRPASTTRRRT